MRKAFSILLLFIFLFNVGGYYIVFWGLRIHTDKHLDYRLDANLYAPEETIELKIPVSLPYPIQSNDFRRVDGRFEHNGEFFKLAKHKLQDDTLYVVCIRDHATRELINTMSDYVQLTQGFPANDNSQNALNYLSKLVKDFYAQDNMNLLHGFRKTTLIQFIEQSHHFHQPVLPVQAPPPRI